MGKLGEVFGVLAEWILGTPDDRARIAYGLKRWSESVEQAGKAIARQPRAGWLRMLRGLARLHLGQAAGALEDAVEGCRLAPDDASAWHNLGWVQAQLGDDAEALRAYAEAERRAAHVPPLLAARAGVHLHRREYGEALALYERMMEDVPDTAIEGRARARALSGDLEGGWADAETLEVRHPRSARPAVLKAGVHFEKGDLEAAQNEALRALSLDPKNGEALHTSLLVDLERRDFAQALWRSENATWGWSAYAGGVAAWCAGNWDAALRRFRRAFEKAAPEIELRNYAALRVWMVEARRQGRRPDGAPDAWLEGPDAWFRSLVGLLRGECADGDVLEQARQDAGRSKEKTLQACFHIGMRRLWEGDDAGAREAFDRALAAGGKRYFEIPMARAEREALDQRQRV